MAHCNHDERTERVAEFDHLDRVGRGDLGRLRLGGSRYQRSRDVALEAHQLGNFTGNSVGALDNSRVRRCRLESRTSATGSDSAGVRTIAGLPVLVSPSVAADTIWGIPQQHCVFVIRQPATVVSDGSALFTKDSTAIRAVLRIGFAFLYPLAVVKVSKT